MGKITEQDLLHLNETVDSDTFYEIKKVLIENNILKYDEAEYLLDEARKHYSFYKDKNEVVIVIDKNEEDGFYLTTERVKDSGLRLKKPVKLITSQTLNRIVTGYERAIEGLKRKIE